MPESTTKLIVGHARHSMTYGRYSKGQRVKLREAINELHYAPDVMRHIRVQTKGDGSRSSTTAKKRVGRTRKS